MFFKERKEKWKTVKIRTETYEQLKKLGTGISEAIDILVKEKASEIETSLEQASVLGRQIADEMLKAGLWNIRFRGFKIDSVDSKGETVSISGRVMIDIPSESAREKIIEVISKNIGRKI
jgi:predicted CopG family antitoxin